MSEVEDVRLLVGDPDPASSGTGSVLALTDAEIQRCLDDADGNLYRAASLALKIAAARYLMMPASVSVGGQSVSHDLHQRLLQLAEDLERRAVSAPSGGFTVHRIAIAE